MQFKKAMVISIEYPDYDFEEIKNLVIKKFHLRKGHKYWLGLY